MPAHPKKIVLAVHGIGDQVRNETALATTVRFCDHFDYPGMISLGSFYGVLEGTPLQSALFVPSPPTVSGLSGEIGFAEVYWAGIPREVDTAGYTLQETKAWALTIVNRVRVLATLKDKANADIDYPRIRLVLEEIIETIAVLESLLFLSRKAGLFDFDLKKVLDAFLGDVQIVTEFAPYRAQILGKFHGILDAVQQLYPDAEIFIVAHSEGTVVSWLGLLEACDDPVAHPWISRVRGYMTLGSPIDKHLILWPALFEKFKGPPLASYFTGPVPGPARPPHAYALDWQKYFGATEIPLETCVPVPSLPAIRWLNYVDYSDPIGFNLNTARDWLKARGYDKIFKFKKEDDYSFWRYPVPGKAHIDYWNDPEVFGHFIRKVVAPPSEAPAPDEKAGPTEKPASKENAETAKGPPSIWWVPIVTCGLSYLLPLGLIHLAVYILCEAVEGYLQPGDASMRAGFVRCVLGLSWLVAGTTIWLRLVRLTRHWLWFALGVVLYGLFGVGFWWMVHKVGGSAGDTGVLNWLEAPAKPLGWPPGVASLAASGAMVALILILNARFWHRARRTSA